MKLLLLVGSVIALVAAAAAWAAHRSLRCPHCRRLPLAGRSESGWPDFSAGWCPHCGARR